VFIKVREGDRPRALARRIGMEQNLEGAVVDEIERIIEEHIKSL